MTISVFRILKILKIKFKKKLKCVVRLQRLNYTNFIQFRRTLNIYTLHENYSIFDKQEIIMISCVRESGSQPGDFVRGGGVQKLDDCTKYLLWGHFPQESYKIRKIMGNVSRRTIVRCKYLQIQIFTCDYADTQCKHHRPDQIEIHLNLSSVSNKTI